MAVMESILVWRVLIAVATCSLNVLKLVMLSAEASAVCPSATPLVTVKPAGKSVTAAAAAAIAFETV